MIHVYIVAQGIPAKSEWIGLWQNVNQGIAALYSKPRKKKHQSVGYGLLDPRTWRMYGAARFIHSVYEDAKPCSLSGQPDRI